MKELSVFFKEKAAKTFKKEGILVVETKDLQEGLTLAKDFLYQVVNGQTVLFLSGGSTPKPLYTTLAKEAKLKAGAVGMIDERFGPPYHENSNEEMIKNTGFLDYLKQQNIAFYPYLQEGKDQEQEARDYDETVRYLFSHFPKNAAILGIGDDGHTAGIAPNRDDFINPIFKESDRNMVFGFNDQNGYFGKRLTMKFDALARIDVLIVLAFGEKKKEALKKMFVPGELEETPSRFYLLPNISQKTLLITDQKV
ncbi:hypothetical protein C4559_05290 [Candidatus Microgenomates bacterium]|nr:MAG: hypothetical protein C4559_05290 [Candidatus Microgenomates bacterium]